MPGTSKTSPAQPASPPRSVLRPMAATIVGIAFFSVMDGVMKHASLSLDTVAAGRGAYNALLYRALLAVLLCGTVYAVRARRNGAPMIRDRAAVRLHVLRGTIATFMALTFFWGITHVPLAEGIAISFIAPLIALYLARLLLREAISGYAIIGSLLGLAGVIVIMAGKMSGGYAAHWAWGVAAILASAVSYAYNLILQRQQAQIAGPLEIVVFQNMTMLFWLALAAPVLAVRPDWAQLGWIALAMMLAVGSLMLVSWAYARAEAQLLIPIEYTAFIWAALVGWLAFGEPLGGWTIIGTAIIIAGCLLAARGARNAPPAHAETTSL